MQELFAQAGTVESASVVEDRDTGRSRGFGFVEMSSKEEGAAAIAQFNGKEVNGRALNVNEAKPRENRGGGGGRWRFGGGTAAAVAATVVTAAAVVRRRWRRQSRAPLVITSQRSSSAVLFVSLASIRDSD